MLLSFSLLLCELLVQLGPLMLMLMVGFCTSFHSASDELCATMSSFAYRLCTVFSLELLSPCRLIALDKHPRVHPIGVMRLIIAKAVLFFLQDDILHAAVGALQLCVGELSGEEAAIHAVWETFEWVDTEAMLLVDASNALIL